MAQELSTVYAKTVDFMIQNGFNFEDQEHDYSQQFSKPHDKGESVIIIMRKPNRIELTRKEYNLELTEFHSETVSFTDETSKVAQDIVSRVS